MAETKLTMSLDDLIAQASKKRERKPKEARQSSGPAPQSGPRKGLNKNRQKNAANGNAAPPPPQQQQQQRPKQQQQPQQQQQPPRQAQGQQQGGQRNRKSGGSNLGVRGGQVQKRNVIEVPVRLIRAPLQAPAPAPRRPSQPQRQPAPDGKWEHDLYTDTHYPNARRAPAPQAAAATTKLIITNLHHQVSEDDLLELFSTCGTVKSRGITFDSSGRSLGNGWVVFETRAEAEAAKKEYHGVKLDGQAMEIRFAESSSSSAGGALTKLSSGISVQKPGAGGGRGGGAAGAGGSAAAKAGNGGQRMAVAAIRETAAASRGGRTGGRANRLRSAVVGRAQLDADLRDYMQE